MVLTESDFDTYLLRNPLLATVIASHFAQRSVVLIGYSLADPDLRQILAMVRDRLGEGARAIYALEVDASPSKIARFARRHVKVINLPSVRPTPGETLELLFRELYEAIGREAPARLLPKTHEGGLAIRLRESRRSCFLAASIETQPNYYEWLGPLSSRLEVPLLTFQDFVAPGDSTLAAVDSMLASAGCALIEQGSTWTNVELGMALNRLSNNRVLIVTPRSLPLAADHAGLSYAIRPESEDDWASFAEFVGSWWTEVLGPVTQALQDPQHALIGEVMVLAGEIEQVLGDLVDAPSRERSLARLVRDAEASVPLSTLDAKLLRDFVDLRNRVAHGKAPAFGWDGATHLVERIRGLVDRLS